MSLSCIKHYELTFGDSGKCIDLPLRYDIDNLTIQLEDANVIKSLI